MEQNLREKYEYAINEEQHEEYKREVLSKVRLPVIIFSFLTLISLFMIFTSGEYFVTVTCAVVTLIFLLIYLNTKKGLKRGALKSASYKLRIYDDYVIFEMSSDNGVHTLTTTLLRKLLLYSNGEKDLVILSTGIHVFPFKRELIKEGSIISRIIDPKYKLDKSPTEPDGQFIEDFSHLAEGKLSASDTAPEAAEYQAAANADDEASEQATDSVSDSPRDEASDEGTAEDQKKAEPQPYLFEMFTKIKRVPRWINLLRYVALFMCLYAIMAIILTAVEKTSGVDDGLLAIGFAIVIAAVNLIIGIVVKKEYNKGYLNAIAAIIIGIAAIVVLLLPAKGYDEQSWSFAESFIEEHCACVGIDLSEPTQSYYYENENGVVDEVTLCFDKELTEKISAEISASKNFKSSLPTAMIGLLPTYSRNADQYKVLIYNVTDKTYNSAPAADGEYEMLCAEYYVYEDGTSDLYLTVYELDYSTVFED